jgi:hypothetical protein
MKSAKEPMWTALMGKPISKKPNILMMGFMIMINTCIIYRTDGLRAGWL